MLILLYGHLGQRFGKTHRYSVRSPAEAVRALCATLPGFRRALRDGGYYKVLRGGREALGLEQIPEPQSERETLRIVPVVSGAGKGAGKILLGTALIAVGFMTGGATLGWGEAWSAGGTVLLGKVATSVGMSLLFSGVAQSLIKTPSAQGVEAVSNRPSYAFDGAVNTAAQGNPVPVCYGRMIVGSQVISAGLSVDQIA